MREKREIEEIYSKACLNKVYSVEFKIGADKKATIIKSDTKIIFRISTFLLI